MRKKDGGGRIGKDWTGVVSLYENRNSVQRFPNQTSSNQNSMSESMLRSINT